MSLKVTHKNTNSLTLHYLLRREDGKYLDTSDTTFKAWASISGTNAQVSLTEDSNVPELYEDTLATVSTTEFTDGNYLAIVRNATPDILELQNKYLKDQVERVFRINQIV